MFRTYRCWELSEYTYLTLMVKTGQAKNSNQESNDLEESY